MPMVGFSGLLLTFLASTSSFGEQKGLHTLLIAVFGWKQCAIIGIGIQAGIILIIPSLYKWI